MKSSLGIFGVGAIGTVITAALHENESISVYYFNRSFKENLNIRFLGQEETIPIQLTSISNTPTLQPSLDWLLISIKEYDYENAKEVLKNLIQPETKVALIRNGLNLYNSVAEFTPRHNVLECMIDCPTQKDGDFYTQLRKGKISIKKNELATQFSNLFNQNQRLAVDLVDDFKTASWEKLIESASLGAILTLSGETCWIFKDPDLVKLYGQLIDEGIQVAVNDGAKVKSNYKEFLIQKLKTYPSNKSSSMLADRQNGKRLELGAKNDIISSLGKRYNVPTPLHDVTCKLLRYTNRHV